MIRYETLRLLTPLPKSTEVFFLQRPCRIDLAHKAHSTVIEYRSTGTSSPNRGIACLTPVEDESFLSGGHDRMVYLWKVIRTPQKLSATSRRVLTDHNHSIRALAYSGANSTVYAAAGEDIMETNLDASTSIGKYHIGAKVTQIHTYPEARSLIALEVSHSPSTQPLFPSILCRVRHFYRRQRRG